MSRWFTDFDSLHFLNYSAAAPKPLFGAAPATTSPFAAPKPAFSFAGGAAGGGLFGSAPAQARKQ